MRNLSLALLLVAGCSSGGGAPKKMPTDASRGCAGPEDCTASPEWMCVSTGSSDAALCQCTASGPEICDGHDNDCNGQIDDGLAVSTTNKTQYVINAVMLPMSRSDFAIDLNGDGKLDNQLSATITLLKTQKVDANAQQATAIMSGMQLVLLDELSSDATFTADVCAGANLFNAVPQAMPDLKGTGHFTVDASTPPGHFRGFLTTSQLDSIGPTAAVAPVSLTLPVTLFPNKTIGLPIIGAHISFTRDASGKLSGQIQGAVRDKDVKNTIIPAFAFELERQVMANPGTPTTQQQLMFFDTGGTAKPEDNCPNMACKNRDGTCAVKNDGKIDECEVATNIIVVGVLGPDVQMYSDDGSTYHPNPANLHKDSLSVGVGFTAVPASF